MADPLPSADDLLGLPSADDLLGAETPKQYPRIAGIGAGLYAKYGSNRDALVDNDATGRILDAIGSGAINGWGSSPVGMTDLEKKQMSELGWTPSDKDDEWNNFSHNPAAGYFKAFNYYALQAATGTIKTLFRAWPTVRNAAVAGIVQAGSEIAGTGKESLKELHSLGPDEPMAGIAGSLNEAADVAGMLPMALPNVKLPSPKVAADLTPYVGMSDDVYFGTKSPPADISLRSEGLQQLFPGQPNPMRPSLPTGVKPKEVAAIEAKAEVKYGPTKPAVEIADDPLSVNVKQDDKGFVVSWTDPKYGNKLTARSGADGKFKTLEEAQEFADIKSQKIFGKPYSAAEEVIRPEPAVVENPVIQSEQAASATPDNSVPTVDEKFIAAEKVGNIQLARSKYTDEQKQAIEELATQQGDASLWTRGVVGVAELEQIASNTFYEMKDLRQRKIGEAYNAEQILNANTQVTQSIDRMHEAAEKLLDPNATEQQHLDFLNARNEAMALITQFFGVKSESGRALRIQKELYEQIKDMERYAEAVKSSDTPLAEGTTIEDVVASQGGKASIKKQAESVVKAKTRKEKAKAAKKSQDPTLLGAALEFGYSILMLSNPKTWGVNILGNVMAGLTDVATDVMGAGVGALQRPFSKNPDRIYFTDVGAKAFGFWAGLPQGFKAGWKALATETATYGRQKVELSHQIPGALGKGVRLPTNIINSTDETFKGMFNHASMYQQAYREAIKKGLTPFTREFDSAVHDILSNPTNAVLEKAAQEAAYNTFSGKLGPRTQATERWLAQFPVAKFFLVPFFRTPASIIGWQAHHTPLGVLSKTVWDNLWGKNGAAARDKQIAKLAFGGGLIYWAYQKAQAGEITGSGPSDPRKYKVWTEQGNKPNSMKIGGRWLPIGNLDPLAKLLTAAADAYTIRDTIKKDDAADVGALLMHAAYENLVNRTWLSTPADLMDAFDERDDFKAEMLIGNMLGRFVPAGYQQFQRSTDDEPYLREARSIIDVVKNKLGQNDDLPFNISLFGEKIETTGTFGNEVKDNPYATAMWNAGYFPAMPDRKIRGIELTGKQYEEYASNSGKLLYLAIKRTIDAVGFQKWNTMPVGVRKDLLKAQGSAAREMATQAFIFKNYKDFYIQPLINKAKDYGMYEEE